MADKPWDDYDKLSPEQVRRRAKAEVELLTGLLTRRMEEIYDYEDEHQGRAPIKENLGDLRNEYSRFRNSWTNRWTNRWR
jgi:hypothetical protein